MNNESQGFLPVCDRCGVFAGFPGAGGANYLCVRGDGHRKYIGEVFLRCVLHRDGRRRYGQRPGAAAGDISFTPASVTITDSAATSLAIPGSYVFDDQSNQKVGFGVGQDDIQFNDPSFATYDMKTSTGPFFEASDPSVADWVNMSTSKGSLTVTSLTDLTFTATLASSSSGGTSSSAVPLPSAAGMSLVGLGLAAIIAYRRRRVAA